MKTELEPQDIEVLAQRVLELLKPIIASNGRKEKEDTVFDVQGLAEYLKVEESWIYQNWRRLRIPSYRLGNQLRFRKKDMDRWLQGQRVP